MPASCCDLLSRCIALQPGAQEKVGGLVGRMKKESGSIFSNLAHSMLHGMSVSKIALTGPILVTKKSYKLGQPWWKGRAELNLNFCLPTPKILP